VKVSLSTVTRWLVDALIAFAWAFALASMDDIHTLGDWAIALGVTILAGGASGRYRVVGLAIGGAFVAALLNSAGTSCGSCEDDLSPVMFGLLLVALLAIPAIVMAVGVFLRKEWARHRRGPWDWANGSEV
jgi:hypothetical protein